MLNEYSAGAIVFTRDKAVIRYLLLEYEYKTRYWDFPRGNIEKGETPVQTALREIKEETGLSDVEIIPAFKESSDWFYMREKQKISKHVIYFLASTKSTEIKISAEHIGFKWAAYDDARKTLTFNNAKKVLDKAKGFLSKQRSLLEY